MIPKTFKKETPLTPNERIDMESRPECPSTCTMCPRPLCANDAGVTIDSTGKLTISCLLCYSDSMNFSGRKIIFKDSYKNYLKREKSGWIKKMLKEYEDGKN